jgi:hypothetical protein
VAIAISEGHGDAAAFLLNQGAESNKKNTDGQLAIAMAPDAKVSMIRAFPVRIHRFATDPRIHHADGRPRWDQRYNDLMRHGQNMVAMNLSSFV